MNNDTHDLSRTSSISGDELVHISQKTEDKTVTVNDVKDYMIADRWEDLRFPVQGINPAGTSKPPTVDTSTYAGTLLFSNSSDNHVAGTAQMPHAWEYGSAISPHIHWSKTTADGSELDVAWKFRYALSATGSAPTSFSSWLDHTLVVGDLSTSEKQNLSTFPEIDMTGHTGSCLILWEIMRDVSEDTYGNDARLYEFDIHFKIDKLGSQDKAPSVGDY